MFILIRQITIAQALGNNMKIALILIASVMAARSGGLGLLSQLRLAIAPWASDDDADVSVETLRQAYSRATHLMYNNTVCKLYTCFPGVYTCFPGVYTS